MALLSTDEKRQRSHRLAPPLIRPVLAQFRAQQLSPPAPPANAGSGARASTNSTPITCAPARTPRKTSGRPGSPAASTLPPGRQNRLPAFFASEPIAELPQANPQIRELRLPRNQHEVHRERPRKPQQAWDTAQKEKRSVLRRAPYCPWWPLVWSQRTEIKVGDDGACPHRRATHPIGSPAPPQSRPLLPSQRPPFRPRHPTRSPNQTSNPVLQPSQAKPAP